MKAQPTNIFVQFIRSEQASGIVLILATLVSIGVANSVYGPAYLDFWQTKVGVQGMGLDLKHSVEHWINDGLMAIFFLLIGLEIERELYIGKLASPREASLPAFAALGGGGGASPLALSSAAITAASSD